MPYYGQLADTSEPSKPTPPDLGPPRLDGSFVEAWKEAGTFRRRTGRKSYFQFVVCQLVLFFGPLGLIGLLGGAGVSDRLLLVPRWILFGYFACSTLPYAAITVRRLHDLNWPALLAVFAFIPTFNLVMILLLSALPTKDSGNKYGLPATWVEDLANGNRLRR